jgi:hypothetical protein
VQKLSDHTQGARLIRNYNFYSQDDFEDLEEPIRLPKKLPDQQCPRCSNVFPGGLKHCTACGLDMVKVRLKPEAALPWEGYDRGIIVCKQCRHENIDDYARRGKVQRCELCSKVIYIPSGLHSPYYEPNIARRQTTKPKAGFSEFLFNAQDILGATLRKFMRSKVKWLIIIALVLGILGLGINSIFLKSKDDTTPVAETPAMRYYQKVLPLRGSVTQAIENFRIIAGDIPDKSNFNYWRNPNNRERFVRACDETLKVIENSIIQLRVMGDENRVPAEAIKHQSSMLDMLYARQMYYARLKDGLNQNNPALWNTAFDLKDRMNDTFSNENAALENMRDLVLNSKNGGK